jgi:redox-sensitive bicupin YhaK (pirin superfamily)
MGPEEFAPGKGLDVRPHPHINLATVTYLFEGAIMHRDSLGYEQIIEPGAINWMTAGSGIVHSERSPQNLRAGGSKLHGLQCWVALPQESEETAPTFAHHPANTLPEFKAGDVNVKLLVGELLGHRSPVKTESDVLYADVHFPAGAVLELPSGERDLAVYLLEGSLTVNGENLPQGSLAVAQGGDGIKVQAQIFSRAMILGGRPLEGERHIYWNFVSSSKERIERAKQEWRDQTFPKIAGDDAEYIPLPE